MSQDLLDQVEEARSNGRNERSQELFSQIEEALSNGDIQELPRLHQKYWDAGGRDREDTAIHMLRQENPRIVLIVYFFFRFCEDSLVRDACIEFFLNRGNTQEEMDEYMDRLMAPWPPERT